MVKNTNGGKRAKRGKRSSMMTNNRRDLILKDDTQEYGLVEKMLGDMRCTVLCSDSTVKLCHIPGKFKRRVWINPGDIVLVSLREFEDKKADIIYKYNSEEAELLQTQGIFDPNHYKTIINGDGNSNIQTIEEDQDNDYDNIDFNNL